MDLNQIKELLNIIAESGVEEVEIEEDDFKLVVRKSASNTVVQTSSPIFPYVTGYPPPGAPTYPPAALVPPQAAPASAVPPAGADAPGVAEASEAAAEGTLVRAPIVGTFYRAPAPDADPYVKEGDTVKPGDILCIIEAMKLMNEIECEVSGTIRKILVSNAEAVEYDQPLFEIDEG